VGALVDTVCRAPPITLSLAVVGDGRLGELSPAAFLYCMSEHIVVSCPRPTLLDTLEETPTGCARPFVARGGAQLNSPAAEPLVASRINDACFVFPVQLSRHSLGSGALDELNA